MKKHAVYLTGLAIALAVAGCSKDKDEDDPTPGVSAKTQLLAGKKWRITGATAATTFAGQTFNADGFAFIPACQRDNTVLFNTDKTAVADEGTTKCSTDAPQSTTGSWSFDGTETYLTVLIPATATSSATTISGEVTQLTASALQLKTTNQTTQMGLTATVVTTTSYAPM